LNSQTEILHLKHSISIGMWGVGLSKWFISLMTRILRKDTKFLFMNCGLYG